jgi:multisubunit Na+/H+ antiporter MnhG subunit
MWTKAPAWRKCLAVGVVCLVLGLLLYGSNVGALLLMAAVVLLLAGAVTGLLCGGAQRGTSEPVEREPRRN